MDQLPPPLETKKKTWEELMKAGLKEEKMASGDIIDRLVKLNKEKKICT